jgi:hypothetical protein
MHAREIAASWRLYIDETGAFKPKERSAAVGLLIRSSDHHALAQGLQQTLQALVPEVAWPLHSTELRQPATLLWHWARLSHEQQLISPIHDVLKRTVDTMSGSDNSAFVRFATEVRARHTATRAWMVELDSELRRLHVSLYNALANRSTEIMLNLASLVRALATHLGSQNCVAVVGLAHASSAACDLSYLDALQSLGERTYTLLRQRPARPECVRMCVAGRRTKDGYLSRELVQKTMRFAQQLPPDPPVDTDVGVRAGSSVQLTADEVIDYRRDANALMVLTDFVANSLYRNLGRSKLTWDALNDACKRAMGLPLMAMPAIAPETGPLPTLGLSGPWRDHARAIFSGKTPVQMHADARWITECFAHYRRWIEAAR